MEVKKRRQLILAQVMEANGFDYHVVDLESEKVLKIGIQSTLDPGGDGDAVVLGTSIYNIGGLRPKDDGFPFLELNGGDGDDHIHLGASCLDLNIPDDDDASSSSSKNKWKAISPMKDFRPSPSCASLGGKLYALQFLEDDICIGEVFDPLIGNWKPLLPPFDTPPISVSTHVISDEKNHRLVVHLYDINSIYAYYPPPADDIGGTWECLVPNFGMWSPAAKALVDDVLFFHLSETVDCLVAFDLSTKTWLNVKYSSNFPLFKIDSWEWDAMLHLGNDILCLANYCLFGDGDDHTNFNFVKFRVERISSLDVLVTFVSSHLFPFRGHLTAHRFLLLP